MAKIKFDIKFRSQIESGEYKVVDNDNHNIRIICWDKKTEKKYGYCIVGLVEFSPKHEESTYYTIDGKARLRDKHPCLFLVTPEPELTEFEKALSDTIGYAISQSIVEPDCETYKFVKDWSEKLLSLAREQLIKDGYVIEKKAFHDAIENISDKHLAEMSVEYAIHCKIENGTRRAIMNWEAFQKVAQKFIDIGKAKALKDLQENLANNDIYRVPEWLRDVLVMAKENGKKEALKDLPRWKKENSFETEGTFIGLKGKECFVVKDGYSVPMTELLTKLPGFKEDE